MILETCIIVYLNSIKIMKSFNIAEELKRILPIKLDVPT